MMVDRSEGGIFAQGVSKQYRRDGNPVDALVDVSVTVRRGEVLGLLGPNGAGKSTLVRILSTLLKPGSGAVWIDGCNALHDPCRARRSIGVALQEVGLDESRSTEQTVLMHARLHGLGRRESRQRVADLLHALGLGEVTGRRIRNLSGGMRRKVDLALALVHRPTVLILDEPTVGLDPPSRWELWEQIRHLRANGTAILLTTQHLEEADQLADQLVILADGRIVAHGSPEELKGKIGRSVLEIGFQESLEAERGAECLGSGSLCSGTNLRWPVADPEALRIGLERLHAEDITPASVMLREPSLDDVFLLDQRQGKRHAP
jgi:ABC-type multidrug transport system ATPase subunit